MKLVAHNGGRAWGGNEKWLATLAQGLMERGHEVVISCRRGGTVWLELERRGIPLAGTRPRGAADVISAARFAAWLRRQQADALLLTSWNRLFWGGWAGQRARVPRTAVRLGIIRDAPARGAKAVALQRWTDVLIVNSPEIRRHWLRTARNWSPDAVWVILNGIGPAPEFSPELRQEVRHELGLPPDALLVTGVGHLVPRKGFDLLINAFAAAAIPRARLLIAGSGPEAEALRARAAGKGIAGQLHLLGQRSDVPRLLAASDIFVLSSHNEGMANVMLEAMNAGTPVLATRVSGVEAALAAGADDRTAGWVVPPADPHAMASELRSIARSLVSDPEAVAARTLEGRRRIAQHFGVTRMIDEAEQALFGAVTAGARS